MPKKQNLLFVIRTRNSVLISRKLPKDVVINTKKRTWTLRGLPSGTIGYFDYRFYYNDSPEDVVGVFDGNNPRHLVPLNVCLNMHMRAVFAQEVRAISHFDHPEDDIYKYVMRHDGKYVV